MRRTEKKEQLITPVSMLMALTDFMDRMPSSLSIDWVRHDKNDDSISVHFLAPDAQFVRDLFAKTDVTQHEHNALMVTGKTSINDGSRTFEITVSGTESYEPVVFVGETDSITHYPPTHCVVIDRETKQRTYRLNPYTLYEFHCIPDAGERTFRRFDEAHLSRWATEVDFEE